MFFNSAKSALRDSRIFAGMDDAALGELAARCKKTDVEAGDVIVDENVVGKEMYLIKEGCVRIVGQRGSANETVFSELGPGEFFGEMCVVESAPRSASVIAAEPTLLYSLSADDIHALAGKRPEQFSILLLNISRDMCRRLRVMNKLFTALLPRTQGSGTQVVQGGAGDVGV